MFSGEILLLFFITIGQLSNGNKITANVDDALNDNLKVLRKDFNILVENVEDFATDFVKQIRNAGKLIESAYDDENYDWEEQEGNKINEHPVQEVNSKQQDTTGTQENGVSSTPKYPNHAKSQDELLKRSTRSIKYQSQNNLPISSKIDVTKKNSPSSDSQEIAKNFESAVLQSEQNENADYKNRQPCVTETSKDDYAEKQKLADLEIEIKKLNDVVSLIKDQQNVITLLQEKDDKNKSLSKDLQLLNNKSKGLDQEAQNPSKETEDDYKRGQKELERELRRQNTELIFVKAMMENLYNKFHNLQKQPESQSQDSLVGSIWSPNLLENQRNEDKFLNVKNRHSSKESTNDKERKEISSVRNSDESENLALNLKLIDLITNRGQTSKEDDDEDKIRESLKQLLLPKKKPEVNTNDLLPVLLQQLTKNKPVPKNNNEIILDMLLNNRKDTVQSKTDGSSTITELIKLQKAIDSLQPNNKADDQTVLNQLLNQDAVPQPGFSDMPALLNALNQMNSGHNEQATIKPFRQYSVNSVQPYGYVQTPFRTGPNYANLANYYENYPPYAPIPNGLFSFPYQPIEDNNEVNFDRDRKQFFLPGATLENDYRAYKYDPQSSVASSLDQPFGNQKNENIVNDLRNQIENLENVIGNLNNYGNYPQSDAATIKALEQRIYELKDVISNLKYSSSVNNVNLYNPLNENYKIRPKIEAQNPKTYFSQAPEVPGPAQSVANINKENINGVSPYQPYNGVPSSGDNINSPSYSNIENPPKGRKKRNEEADKTLQKIAEILNPYIPNESLRPSTDERARSSAINSLQNKLDALKIQLDTRQTERSLLPINYAYQNNAQNDVLTEIIVKILEKVFNALPEALNRLFGNLVMNVGNSYGDYDSTLQNIVRNLGPVGQVPLILIKILETAGAVFKHLKGNNFFKQFLLPASILGLVGGAVLFLIYFLQQDEPKFYGIDYAQQPEYGPNIHKYRSSMKDHYFDSNNRRTSNRDYNFPLQFYRGYYDYNINAGAGKSRFNIW